MILLEEYVAAAHKAMSAAGFSPEASQTETGFALSSPCGEDGDIVIKVLFDAGKQPTVIAEGIAEPSKQDYTLALAALNALNRLPGHVRFSIGTDGQVRADARGMFSASSNVPSRAAALDTMSSEVSALVREVAMLAQEGASKLEDLL